jgi:hypothetical protein
MRLPNAIVHRQRSGKAIEKAAERSHAAATGLENACSIQKATEVLHPATHSVD